MSDQNCTVSYDCNPKWYDATDRSDPPTGEAKEDVVARAAGPYAEDINVVCFVGTGSIEFQVQNPDGDWFTPSEASYTVAASNCVRLPRANMPAVRIIANGDAKFHVQGSLR